jgi:hypothetical protein
MDDKSPPRAQLNVMVPVETKERLVRGAAYLHRTVTQLIEEAADHLEHRTIERLKLSDKDKDKIQELYYSGQVSKVDVFPANEREIGGEVRQKWQKAEKLVPLSAVVAMLRVERKAQLTRYAAFYNVSIAVVLDRLSRNMERLILEQLSPEDRPIFLAGKFEHPLPTAFFDDAAE